MAILASTSNLAAALSDGHVENPHCWITEESGLVLGLFPNAALKFDFATERFLEIGGKNLTIPTIVVPATKTRKDLLHLAKRVGQRYEIETPTTIFVVGSATQALKVGLEQLEAVREGTLDKLATEKKRTKRPVARDRTDLYDVDHAKGHSEALSTGHYIATNNKAHEAIGYLKRAAMLAGLSWGAEFEVRPIRSGSPL